MVGIESNHLKTRVSHVDKRGNDSRIIVAEGNRPSGYGLRPYQQAAVDAVYQFLRTKTTNPCIVAPTGCGKSLLISTVCRDAVMKWNGRVLVLAHVKELLEQTAQTIHRLAPELKVGVYSAGLKSKETNAPIIVAGIQSVYKKACELDRFDLVIVDECHLLPPDGEGMYQIFFRDAKIVNPRVRLIGLTATPYRLKSGMLCGPDNLLNEVCYEIGVRDLIQAGFLCPLKSKSGRHKVDTSDLHIRAGEFIAAEVDALMNTTDNVDAAVREIISVTRDRHSILIFGSSVDHANRIKETIEKWTQQECGLVTGDTPAAERDRILRRFKGQKFAADLLGTETRPLKYLVNVNVLTTGFDAPNIDCIVLLRPTASPGLFVQMCLDMGTEVLTPNGWRRCHEIAVGDTVGTFDLNTEEIVYSPVEEKVHRPLRRYESMYGIKSTRLDIRVTNHHNMVVRAKGRTCLHWQLQTAEHIATRREGYHIPIAGKGEVSTQEANLSDAEISFIGWFLTDGYKSHCNGTVTISQSEVKFHEEIRLILNRCGFGFREYRHTRKGNLSKYRDIISFVIPRNESRGDQAGKKGWSYLEAWLDKDIPTIFNSLSKRQFVILLQAMDKANGSNCDHAKLDYAPRTITIALGCRQRFADRIQQLAIERGFRCDVRHVRQKPSAWNRFPQEQWMVALRELSTAFVGGTRIDKNELIPTRCHFGPVNYTPNEWVWCLTTEKGTLVTRRNGKVAIVGNCGRGFRLHETKTDCLVLDYGGNILRHGPVDAVQVKDKNGKGGGEAPAKECPKCQSIVHAAVMVCPNCGHEFPPPERDNLENTASNEGVLTGEIVDTEYDIEEILYSVHTKRGADENAAKTLRVDYCVGLNDYHSEWVCPEHSGWARKKFEKWWQERSNDPVPDTAELAARIGKCGGIAEAKTILVRKVGGEKFGRIVKYTLAEKPHSVSENFDEEINEYSDPFEMEDEEVPF